MKFIKLLIKSFFSGPVFVILFGLVFFGVGAGLTYRQNLLESQDLQTQGEVVNLAENCDDDGCTYSPVVRFQTEDGQNTSFQSSYSSSPPAYDIGEKVTVIYSPDNPKKAVIKGEGQLFRIIFMIVGGVVVIFGLVAFSKNIGKNYFEQSG